MLKVELAKNFKSKSKAYIANRYGMFEILDIDKENWEVKVKVNESVRTFSITPNTPIFVEVEEGR